MEILRAFENLGGSHLTWDVDVGRQGRGIACKDHLP